jgi:hypothetical protein
MLPPAAGTGTAPEPPAGGVGIVEEPGPGCKIWVTSCVVVLTIVVATFVWATFVCVTAPSLPGLRMRIEMFTFIG